MVGVGMTPPKVLGTPKPASSVMISSTLGAPAGGTTRGAHQGVDCRALFLITPPNFGSGDGSCLPLMLVVALGDPSVPVICSAVPDAALISATTRTALSVIALGDVLISLPLLSPSVDAAHLGSQTRRHNEPNAPSDWR